jgi:hypothetical protein
MKKQLLAAVALTFALASAPALAANATVGTSGNGTVGVTTGDGTSATGTAGASAGATATTKGTDATATGSINGNLGVDISGAGTTAASQTTFFNSLSAQEQQSLRGRCGDTSAMTNFTAEERTFCTNVIKK